MSFSVAPVMIVPCPLYLRKLIRVNQNRQHNPGCVL
jgi:hypothetical protein